MKTEELKNIMLLLILIVLIVLAFKSTDIIQQHLFSALSVIAGVLLTNHISNFKQIKNDDFRK